LSFKSCVIKLYIWKNHDFTNIFCSIQY
jgi:hypothetical protein